MSRNLFSILSSLKLKWTNSILLGFPIHFSYSYFSQKNKNIEISDKYCFDANGYTNFMVIDTENNHYTIGNNLWFWKWDSIEDWSKIKNGTKIDILYYGYRVPIFGFFPNIIDSNYNNWNVNKTNYNLSSKDIGDILTTPNASITNNTALSTANVCAK